jgi:hypothetical protein
MIELVVYYFIPLNAHDEAGYIGSLSHEKISVMSKRDSNGMVYQCDISEFKGELLSVRWQ